MFNAAILVGREYSEALTSSLVTLGPRRKDNVV